MGEHIAWSHSMFRAKTWQNTFQVIIPCLWQNHNENLCISYLNVISHVYIGTIGHCPQWWQLKATRAKISGKYCKMSQEWGLWRVTCRIDRNGTLLERSATDTQVVQTNGNGQQLCLLSSANVHSRLDPGTGVNTPSSSAHSQIPLHRLFWIASRDLFVSSPTGHWFVSAESSQTAIAKQ